MSRVIEPAKRVGGTIELPGDKSISHRYAMLSAIGEGSAMITNYSTNRNGVCKAISNIEIGTSAVIWNSYC